MKETPIMSADPAENHELRLARRASEGAVARVREHFARLGARGVEVEIRRDGTKERPSQDDAA